MATRIWKATLANPLGWSAARTVALASGTTFSVVLVPPAAELPPEPAAAPEEPLPLRPADVLPLAADVPPVADELEPPEAVAAPPEADVPAEEPLPPGPDPLGEEPPPPPLEPKPRLVDRAGGAFPCGLPLWAYWPAQGPWPALAQAGGYGAIWAKWLTFGCPGMNVGLLHPATLTLPTSTCGSA
jgi:hypothetical protein